MIEINNKIPNSWKLIDDAAATLPNIPYASLSHCWGQIPLLRLTRATVSEMKRGMSISSLPKPFQDALTVTKYFSISHIWINSLCILQDSIQDWQQESMKMREVYTYADFNIAATAAAQGKDGCFFDRPVSRFKPWTVKPDWAEGKDPGIFSSWSLTSLRLDIRDFIYIQKLRGRDSSGPKART